MTPRHLSSRLWTSTIVVTLTAFSANLAFSADNKVSSNSSRKIEMRPSEKRSLALRGDERNPYARRVSEISIIEDKEGVPEEDRIRQVLSGLDIGGRSDGPNGPRVLIGDIILEEGKIVPPVLEDQTELLVVKKITEKEIELAWFDGETGALTGRRLNLKFNLDPAVNYVLKGQRSSKTGNSKTAVRPKLGRMRPLATQAAPALAKPNVAHRQGGNSGSTSNTIYGPNAWETENPSTAQRDDSRDSNTDFYRNSQ